MGEALLEAASARRRGDLGVGAVIVIEGQIVGRGSNRSKSSGDSTTHAEVTAFQDFERRHPGHSLERATLFSTYQPCPMCLGACLVMKLPNLAIGAIPCPSDQTWGDYNPDRLLNLVRPAGLEINIVHGIRADECLSLRNDPQNAPPNAGSQKG